MTTVVVTRVIDSPAGPLLAAATDAGLAFLEFSDNGRLERQMGSLHRHFGQPATGDHPILDQTAEELAQYFAGARKVFTMPLVLRGTPFQESVWRELLAIPFGETRSYQELAHSLGSPNGQRAVGLANGQNRISIVVPCHRVIEKGGGLRGYGGGLWRKKLLLDLERRVAGDPLAGTPLGATRARAS